MKFLKIAGLIVIALFAILLVFIATFDIGKYKGAIEAQAKTATGRTVTIGGIRLAASLTPTVTLSDVKVANAPWGTRPDMVIIKRLDVHANLLPLLTGTVSISGVSAEEPDLWLESDGKGKANWVMGGGDSGAAPSQGKNPLSLSGVDVKGLKLAYKDGTRVVAAGVKSLNVRGALQDMVIATLDLQDATVSLKEGKGETAVAIGKATLEADGKIADLGITNLVLSDVSVLQKGDGAPTEAIIAKLSLDRNGALQVAATVNGQEIKASGTLAPIAVLAAMNKPFPAKLTIDGMGLKAETDLSVTAKNGHPDISGKISIPEVDLSASKASKGEKAPPAGGSDRMFSDAPLPWAVLSEADADVHLSVGKVTLPNGLAVNSIVLPIDLAKGKLGINGFTAAIAGGTLTGSMTANAGDKAFSLALDGKGMSAETIAKELKKSDFITQGPIDLRADVRGRGNSLHAIMASLDGSLLAGMGESRIKNSNLNMIGADVLTLASAINPVGNKDPYTVSRCAVANFQITDGVARTDSGIAFVTDKMQVTSSGTVNLGTEQIDLAVRPKASGGLGIGLGSLAQAVRVSGSLAHPSVGIDKAGAAKSLGTLGLAFASGGTSLLAQGATDRATGGDPCQAARAMKAK